MEYTHPFTHFLDRDMTIWAAGDDTPTDEDLNQAERRLGWTFPREYCSFQRQFGGMLLEAKESAWPRPKEYDVGPMWTFMYGFVVLGFGKDIPDWLSLEFVAHAFWKDDPTVVDLLPVFHHMSSADRVCFDRSGALVQWYHDDPGRVTPLGEVFDDMLVRTAKELVERKEKMKANLKKR